MSSNVTLNVVAPVALADYTRSEMLVPQLRERDTAGIISELSQVLQRHGCVPDVLPFYHEALNQELLVSSATGSGVAFPHARLGAIKQLQFALGRLNEPVSWGSGNAARVSLIFLLAVPATDAAGYLHLLSSLARLGQRPEVIAQLQKAETANDMLQVLNQVPIRQ